MASSPCHHNMFMGFDVVLIYLKFIEQFWIMQEVFLFSLHVIHNGI